MVSIPGAGGRVAVPARGENRAPPPRTHFVTNNDCQIKCKLLQIMSSIGCRTEGSLKIDTDDLMLRRFVAQWSSGGTALKG